MSRLTGKSVKEIESDRINIARNFAVKYKITLILKGAHSLIAGSDGHVYINTTGNTGLSKGGSGDVLAGFIGGLLAQGYTCTESAALAVYLHGKAADILKDKISESGMIPSDLIIQIAELLKTD